MIGREKEIEILEQAIRSETPQFIAVYGRRRVGKTYLVRETVGYRFTFQHTGLSGGTMGEQIAAFELSLKESGLRIRKKAHNWMDAFSHLKELISASTEKKKIVFIDELSWMDTPKSDLMMALEFFWNAWASARNDIVLIVCSSATSWILSKIIHNKGGLYNRLTCRIRLLPFSLHECETYITTQGISLSRGQILQCYMILGGIPYYWSFLKKGLSLSQNIDQMMFSENAPLKDEFQYLYAAIFKKPDIYIKIVQALAQKKVGMTREELISAAGVGNTGNLTTKLEELESCGFIRKYQAFGMKKKNALYQLMDFFTLFYYRFMETRPTDEHFWSNQIKTPAINVWHGLAFERVCLSHISQIKQKLGIMGVLTHVNSWSCKEDKESGVFGSQIDLLIVRNDQIINLCEMKYSESEYTVTQDVDRGINRKIHDLQTVTKTRYAIHPTLITSYGVVDNPYAFNMQAVITMNDLFL